MKTRWQRRRDRLWWRGFQVGSLVGVGLYGLVMLIGLHWPSPPRFDMQSWKTGLMWGLHEPAIARACLDNEQSTACLAGITIPPVKR